MGERDSPGFGDTAPPSQLPLVLDLFSPCDGPLAWNVLFAGDGQSIWRQEPLPGGDLIETGDARGVTNQKIALPVADAQNPPQCDAMRSEGLCFFCPCPSSTYRGPCTVSEEGCMCRCYASDSPTPWLCLEYAACISGAGGKGERGEGCVRYSCRLSPRRASSSYLTPRRRSSPSV